MFSSSRWPLERMLAPWEEVEKGREAAVDSSIIKTSSLPSRSSILHISKWQWKKRFTALTADSTCPSLCNSYLIRDERDLFIHKQLWAPLILFDAHLQQFLWLVLFNDTKILATQSLLCLCTTRSECWKQSPAGVNWDAQRPRRGPSCCILMLSSDVSTITCIILQW